MDRSSAVSGVLLPGWRVVVSAQWRLPAQALPLEGVAQASLKRSVEVHCRLAGKSRTRYLRLATRCIYNVYTQLRDFSHVTGNR